MIFYILFCIFQITEKNKSKISTILLRTLRDNCCILLIFITFSFIEYHQKYVVLVSISFYYYEETPCP